MVCKKGLDNINALKDKIKERNEKILVLTTNDKTIKLWKLNHYSVRVEIEIVENRLRHHDQAAFE